MIILKGLSKSFGRNSDKQILLNQADLFIEANEFVVLWGPSGSGKTTLLNIIGLLDDYDEGTYILDGNPLDALSRSRKQQIRKKLFGYVFQQFNLIPELNALENVEMPLGYANWNKIRRRERALECLSLVGIENHARKKPHELSGGQQQRVAIARALSASPQILLADEPTGNLDQENSIHIIDSLKKIKDKLNTILIIVTHDKFIARQADVCYEIAEHQIKRSDVRKL